MLRVTVTDTEGKVYIEETFAENTVVKDIKKQLLIKLKLNCTQECCSTHKDGLKLFTEDNVETVDSAPIEKYSCNGGINLQFDRSPQLDRKQHDGKSDGVGALDRFKTNENKLLKLSKKILIEKDGKTYLVVERKKKSALLATIRNKLRSFHFEFILKCVLIMMMFALKNKDLAMVLGFLMLLTYLSTIKIFFLEERQRGRLASVVWGAFMFFYSLFVMN